MNNSPGNAPREELRERLGQLKDMAGKLSKLPLVPLQVQLTASLLVIVIELLAERIEALEQRA